MSVMACLEQVTDDENGCGSGGHESRGGDDGAVGQSRQAANAVTAVIIVLVAKVTLLQSLRPRAVTRMAPSGRPRMKARRHGLSVASVATIAFETMPLIPATRPMPSISMTAERPIRAPPIKPGIGAKLVMTRLAMCSAPAGYRGSRRQNIRNLRSE